MGYEHVHVCIEDSTRLAYAEILPAEDAASAMGFLQRATYQSALATLGVRHLRLGGHLKTGHTSTAQNRP